MLILLFLKFFPMKLAHSLTSDFPSTVIINPIDYPSSPIATIKAVITGDGSDPLVSIIMDLPLFL
jgi:hypothetical protein